MLRVPVAGYGSTWDTIVKDIFLKSGKNVVLFDTYVEMYQVLRERELPIITKIRTVWSAFFLWAALKSTEKREEFMFDVYYTYGRSS